MPETFSRWDAANYIDTPEDAGLFSGGGNR